MMYHDTAEAFVLASQSPRRVELLRYAGFQFKVVPAKGVVEKPRDGEGAADYVCRNAQMKAEAVASNLDGDVVVLAADTVVTLSGKIYEKPENVQQARQMLSELSGRQHSVLTGYVVLTTKNETQHVRCVETLVTFKQLTTEEINYYLSNEEYLDKAGAYAAQGRAVYFISQIQGSYSNVIGLPMVEVMGDLASVGVKPCFSLAAPAVQTANINPKL